MSIVFLGDIMLGRLVTPVVQRVGLWRMFEPIRHLVDGHHVVANLESPLCRPHLAESAGTNPVFYAEPALAEELHKVGFSFLSLANNHTFDCGVEGFVETEQALDQAGILHAGAGRNRLAAMTGAILNAGGRRVGFLGFSFTPPATESAAGVAYLYDNTVSEAICKLRPQVDFLVAMPHSGIELYQFPLPRDCRAYRQMIDLGADLVVGSNPHCVQPMEIYKGKHIFYSIGDAIFDHHSEQVWREFFAPVAHAARFSLNTGRDLPKISLQVRLDFDQNGPSIDYEPLVMGDAPGPRPMSSTERKAWSSAFHRLCSAFAEDQAVSLRSQQIEDQLLQDLRARGVAV